MHYDTQFWRFSTQLYAIEGVLRSLLRCQNECDVEINLLLYVFWQGSQCRTIDSYALQQLSSATQRWRDVVVMPIRRARMETKVMQSSVADRFNLDIIRFRDHLKRVELESEQIYQYQIWRWGCENLFGEEGKDRESQSLSSVDNAVEIAFQENQQHFLGWCEQYDRKAQWTGAVGWRSIIESSFSHALAGLRELRDDSQ